MSVIGSVDQYDPLVRRVKGWAAKKVNDVVERLTVVLKQSGEVLDEFEPGLYREDLESAGLGDGFFSFEVTLPELDPGSVVSFHDKATGELLPQGELVIRDALSCVRYNLEEVSDTLVRGWALHTEHKRPLEVMFRLRPTAGGRDIVVAQGLADQPREDVDAVRVSGFKLATNLQTIKAFPARLMMSVEGVEIADCHILLPMSTDAVMRQMEKRLESMMGLTIRRMEQETQALRQELAAHKQSQLQEVE